MHSKANTIRAHESHSRRVERFIERTILYSRWILVVFYLGLAVALAMYGMHFLSELASTAMKLPKQSSSEVLLKMLVFIDKALVASLIVMVMLSGYENFISRIEVESSNSTLAWLGKLDPTSIKIKVASSIVAISSIHLLQVFLNIRTSKRAVARRVANTYSHGFCLFSPINGVSWTHNTSRG